MTSDLVTLTLTVDLYEFVCMETAPPVKIAALFLNMDLSMPIRFQCSLSCIRSLKLCSLCRKRFFVIGRLVVCFIGDMQSTSVVVMSLQILNP